MGEPESLISEQFWGNECLAASKTLDLFICSRRCLAEDEDLLKGNLAEAKMAKREISSTLRNLKFMQRATQRDDVKKEEEIVKPGENFSFPSTVRRKCVVIMEGDPQPGALVGRMSFQSFNPSIDKLNEEATNPRTASTPSSSDNEGRMSFSGEKASSIDEAEGLKVEQSRETDGDSKRKQSDLVSEQRYPNKSQKNVHHGKQSSPSNGKGAVLKQPKRDNVDWSVLRPPKPQNRRV